MIYLRMDENLTLVVTVYGFKIGMERRYRILDAPWTAPPPCCLIRSYNPVNA